MLLGFDVNGGSLLTDLALTHGSTYVNFASPLNPPVPAEVAAGVQVLRVLRYHDSCPNGVDSGCTKTLTDLATFATANKGQHYETGNEPGIGGQDNLDAGFYTWQNAAYHAIKNADPTAIDGPGVFNWNDLDYASLQYLQGITLYASGNAMLYDRVALHEYSYDWCLDDLSVGDGNVNGSRGWITTSKAAIDGAVATGKPVDITEIGDHWPQCVAWGIPVSAATRQTSVQTVVDYARAKGVKAMIWYLNREDASTLTGWLVGSLTPSDQTLQPEALGWIQ